jgi:ketosteroid isomerase-like protein
VKDGNDDVAANKALVKEFFAALSRNDRNRLRSLVDPAGDWWTVSRRSAAKVSEVLDQFDQLWRSTTSGMRLEVGTITAEGPRVAALAESHADFADGRHYNNLYHFLFSISRGRIEQLWEYADTAYARDVLRPGISASAES